MVDIIQLSSIIENRYSDNYTLLIEAIRHLINNDFEKLVQLLYRIDVSEKRIKEFLKTNLEKDAAVIIADLMIERQAQKSAARHQGNINRDIPDEDKW